MADLINVSDEHGEAEELLPWYATGRLEGEEQALVERHLVHCAHCRRQLAAERRIIEEFAAMTPEIDAGWDRIRSRLEPRKQVARRPGWRELASGSVAAGWQGLRRPAVAAVAFAQLAFLIVAGSLLFTLSRPSYHALGSAPALQSANVIVMFRGDTTESQLHRLLQASGASLVGGPTSTDAYLVHVPIQSRPVALTKLRGDRHVIMAQPIDGGRS